MQRRCVNYMCIYAACMNPAPNGSSTLQHFERGDAIEIHNRIMFDFYCHIYYSIIVLPYSRKIWWGFKFGGDLNWAVWRSGLKPPN